MRVQRARDQLLAGAGLAGDERGADVRREPPDHPEQLLHRRAAADHPAELQPPRDVALDRQQVAAALEIVAHAGQQLLEPREVERLAQVVGRAQLDRLDRGLDRRVAGHQHRLAARIDVADGAQHVEAAEVRHPQVDHDEIGAPRLQLRDRVAAVRARQRVVAGPLREPADHVEDALFVVDHDQQGLLPVHTYSFESPRSAPRSADSS